MKDGELQRRTKAFALQAVRFVESLPSSKTAEVLGRQLLRSATSVGANYRAVCRAKSKSDFIAKLAIVEEEADECSYWLDLLVEAKLVNAALVAGLRQEADEITAMIVASIQQAKRTRAIEHSPFPIPHSPLAKGQALIELAVFGSMILLLLGVLLNFGLNADYTQQATMKSFREALRIAADPSLRNASYTLVQDRHIPNPSSPFGTGALVPVATSASVTWNPEANKVADPGEVAELPQITLQVDGGACPGSQLSPAGSRPPCKYLTAGFRTERGVEEDSVDRYLEVYGAANVCMKDECGGSRPGRFKRFFGARAVLQIIDACGGEIISYEGCIRQARVMTDSGFCTQECEEGKPPESEKDCAKICSFPVNRPLPWYAVNCQAADRCPPLDALFRDIKSMGLQPGYLKVNQQDLTLSINGNASTTSGSVRERTTRTIIMQRGGVRLPPQKIISDKDVQVDGSFTAP